MFTTGGRTQSVERPATQKALGGPIAFGMTSEARDWHYGVKRICPGAFEPFESYMINLTSLSPSRTEQISGVARKLDLSLMIPF